MSTINIFADNLNEVARRVHQANIKWWQNIDTGEPIQRNQSELCALVMSELSEALEGERKDLMDDKLTHRKMAEVEMADAYIRLMDYSAGFDIPLIRMNPNQPGLIPNNKGEAIFCIMKTVALISDPDRDQTDVISFTLAQITGYCAKHGYDLRMAFIEKMAYNATREDHTHEARKIAGGKQF